MNNNNNKITKKINKFIKKETLAHPSESGKRCELCHKNKPSRQYYKPIDGKSLKVCDDCWNELEAKRRTKSEQRD